MDPQRHLRERLGTWRRRMHQRPLTRWAHRVVIGLAGLTCMIGSVLTGWLPGPGGIPLFLLGLWIWSTEFTWAERLMAHVKRMLEAYQRLPAGRRRLLVAGLLAAALAGWYAWAAWQGLPTWLPGGFRHQLAHLPLLDE